MSTIFRNPPLIEMIAELRWGAPAIEQSQPPLVLPDRAAPYEGMFMRWVAKMGASGYEPADRLVPHGMPLPAYDPVIRVNPKDAEERTTLFQLGPQLFTANAIPPYRSWNDFAPRVRTGVAALLDTRPKPDAQSPLLASLRYIDAFRDDLRQGQSLSRFLSETLGIHLSVPPAIERHRVEGEDIRSLIQLAVPSVGGVLRIQFAEGEVQSESALLMDMTFTMSEPVTAELEAVMAAFERAHVITHQVFMELTAPIANLMQPEGDDT